MFRWNLVVFFVGLLFVLGGVLGFAVWVLMQAGVITGNEEMLVAGVLTMVASALAGTVGYAVGVQQALTSPPPPPPAITEETVIKLFGK